MEQSETCHRVSVVIRGLLGCFAACSGNPLPTFQDNLSFPSSRNFLDFGKGIISRPETSAGSHYTLHNNPEECRSDLHRDRGRKSLRVTVILKHSVLFDANVRRVYLRVMSQCRIKINEIPSAAQQRLAILIRGHQTFVYTGAMSAISTNPPHLPHPFHFRPLHQTRFHFHRIVGNIRNNCEAFK